MDVSKAHAQTVADRAAAMKRRRRWASAGNRSGTTIYITAEETDSLLATIDEETRSLRKKIDRAKHWDDRIALIRQHDDIKAVAEKLRANEGRHDDL